MLREAPRANEFGALEREYHLVHCRRRDAEMVLDVAFGGRPPVKAGVGVDERQIPALLGSEAGRCFAVHLIDRPIQLGLQDGGRDEHTLSRRSELRRAGGTGAFTSRR